MKVAIIGTRGIPAKYGGFETFAQEVSIRLVQKGVDVTVFCPLTENSISEYLGVKLKYISVSKDHSPMKYYFKSVSEAVKSRFDIVLTCGQGGYAYLPYIRRSDRPVFITNTDGIEHRRTKWNKIIRLGVKFVGEMISVILSDYLVADSKEINNYLSKEYKIIPKRIYTIEYGAELISMNDYPEKLLNSYNITPWNYFLVVSRLEPENNVAMIIDGYKKSKTAKPLIVVGNLKNTSYINSLRKSAEGYNVQFIGGVYEPEKLKALRIYSVAYLHGHSVGGTNPSLLEALGAGNIVIGHDNPFNREVTENREFYFSSSEECAKAIEKVDMLSLNAREELKSYAIKRIMNYYNWDRIADKYYMLFQGCVKI
ncbi:DUF1972 domain-containing protein [Parabacteroides faecis]|uniref:DUF1972 domain-containing protein n=1 Tax=Parabacteroides faecis TaxID=1217282 RepID=UPI002164EFF6|nr:DUF1972 domain-containing protein [Parabacteroides faecis]MCS2892492.1 DUF1972 domain-containing protein [Parabacteroides faecis]UVQ48872.1 DUF1972 domain-containing protein [Parabacteroides faecis]